MTNNLGSRIRQAKKRAIGALAGIKDRCSKGKSCSATCISRWKECLVEMPEMVSSSLKEMRGQISNKTAQFRKNPRRFLPGEERKKILSSKVERFWELHKSLKDQMLTSAEQGQKGNYDKAERKLLRLENRLKGRKLISQGAPAGFTPTKKGVIWNNRAEEIEYRYKRHSLLNRMRNYAAQGRRGSYKNAENELDELIRGKVGRRLNDPMLEKGKEWRDYAGERRGSRESKFNRVERGISDKLHVYAKNGNRGAYEKLEKKWLDVVNKGGAQFGKSQEKKNSIWNMYKAERQMDRERRYRSIKRNFISALTSHAATGNKAEYDKVEGKLLSLLKKAGAKHGDTETYEKGSTWKKARLANLRSKYYRARNDVAEKLERATKIRDKEAFDKYAAKFEKLSKAGEKFDYRPVPVDLSKYWKAYENSVYSKVQEELKRNGIEAEVVPGNNSFRVNSTVMGNKLSIFVDPFSTSFKVNGSYTIDDPSMPDREKFSITRQVKLQYNSIFRSLEEGTVLNVEAASGDGREEARERAYRRAGFSDPNYDGQMYGVISGGKVRPSDKDEYNLSDSHTFDSQIVR